MDLAEINKVTARAALARDGVLANFMTLTQRRTLLEALDGEEAAHFAGLVSSWATAIMAMPKTGEQDGKGDEAIVWLHYFIGGIDAWITERDKGTTIREEAIPGVQHQAFGFMNLDDPENAELGYISINELIRNGAELDLYWAHKTLAEVKKGLEA